MNDQLKGTPAEPGLTESSPSSLPSQNPPPDGSQEISLLGVVNFLLRHIRLLVVLPLVTVVVALAVAAITREERYTARSTLLPPGASGQAESPLQGLASQYGLIGRSTGSSPQFYIDLLRSRRVLTEAAGAQYVRLAENGDTIRGTLSDLYEIDGGGIEDRTRSAAARLAGDVEAAVNTATGILTLETSAPWPEVAVQINRNLIRSVEAFNRDRRQTEAKAERVFVEARLDEARQNLGEAERRLEAFLEGNRYYQNAPQLVLQANRLQREVDLRQELYTSLAQALEQARIEEVRYTPVVTVVDDPEGSTSAVTQPLLLIGLAALFLGAILALAFAGVREYLVYERTQQPQKFAEFQRLTAARSFVNGYAWPLRRNKNGAAETRADVTTREAASMTED